MGFVAEVVDITKYPLTAGLLRAISAMVMSKNLSKPVHSFEIRIRAKLQSIFHICILNPAASTFPAACRGVSERMKPWSPPWGSARLRFPSGGSVQSGSERIPRGLPRGKRANDVQDPFLGDRRFSCSGEL